LIAANIAERAAAEIEGHSEAAKFGQPGRLSYNSLTTQASECPHSGHVKVRFSTSSKSLNGVTFANSICIEHFGHDGCTEILGIAAPFSGGSVIELSVIDAWHSAAVDDGIYVR
jgi:hypothetical protein